jgi:choline dehydrogenase-like flavoprotein
VEAADAFPQLAEAAARRFRRATLFSTIVEDLPYAENRVIPDPNAPNGRRFEYTYARELDERNRHFRRQLIRRLAPRHRIRFVTGGGNNLNYGHVCGTCRFGDDPATSVLDRTNRAHDLDNLYVVDASFFPSSGGTNPSLTIAANALRVGEVIDRRLGPAAPGS